MEAERKQNMVVRCKLSSFNKPDKAKNQRRTPKGMKIAVLFFALIFPSYGIGKECWNDINFEKTERILSRPPIRIFPLDIKREGVSFFTLKFKNNIKGFYKVKRKSHISSALKAVRMYHFSKLMGFNFVPPTSILMGHSVQLYIDNLGLGFDDKIDFLSKLKEKFDIYIFYFLFGNLDPSPSNILIGKKCNKPAVVDNDWMNISHIKFGDYPFRLIKTTNAPAPRLSVEDYKNFPFNKVESVKFSSTKELRNYLMNRNIKKSDVIYFFENFKYFQDKTLYIVKYKNVFWIKMNHISYKLLWKDFIPRAVSKRTLLKLKKINKHKLEKIFNLTDTVKGYNFKLNDNFKASYISLILHRKAVLLEELHKLPVLKDQ